MIIPQLLTSFFYAYLADRLQLSPFKLVLLAMTLAGGT